MRKSRKLVCVLLIGIIGLTFVTFQSIGAEEKTPLEIYNPQFKFPAESVTLTFWEIYGERPGWYKWAREVGDKYSQIHPNIKIKVREIPVGEYEPLYLSAIEAGTVPDVFCLFNYRIHQWELALPAPEWAERIFEEEYIDAANVWQRYPENGANKEYQGKYLGWMSSELDCGQMLYYNRDMFTEAGLDPDNPPKVAPELVEVMKKLTKYGPGGKVVRGGWGIRYFGHKGGITDKFSKFLWWWRDDTKGYLFAEDWNDVAAWDSPPFVEAVKFYQDLVWKYKVSSLDMPAPAEAFKLGLVAMTNRETFLEGVLKRDAPWLNYGIASLINGAAPLGQYEVGVWNPAQLSCVWKGTKYPDVAWDFNMFLNTDPHDLELSELAGGFPRRKANKDSKYAQGLVWRGVFEEMFQRPLAREEAFDPWGLFGEFQDILGDAVVSTLVDEKADAETNLKAALRRARESLASAMEAAKKK